VTTAALVEAVDLAEDRGVSRTTQTIRRLAGCRILVAEDTPLNQEVAVGILEQEGAEVVLAADGQEALGALANVEHTGQPFDIVLMVMMMPNMDGLEATRRIRADSPASAIPIVAMSANAMAADRDRCLAAGMDDHVAKPLDVDRMVDVILRYTNARHDGTPALREEDAAP
jgi:CheY-like chemotaxis protein